jgi:LmbE family N-acetylglucosaminyl deacetylase
LHEIAFVRERWMELMAAMKERGIEFPWARDGEEQVAEESESVEFGRPDAEVTTRIDVSAHVEQKRRSMDCHRTQRQDMGWLLDLPPDLGAAVMSTELYVLRWLDGRDVPSTYREESLLGDA